MSRGFAFSHVLLCKIFNVHCGSTSEIFSVARKGRKQVSTCGHKFSMLEKLLSTQSSLLGQALVGAKPLHLLSQTALPLESPTGAFIATQTRSCWGVPSPDACRGNAPPFAPQIASPFKAPTGGFIACANTVLLQLLILRKSGVSLYIALSIPERAFIIFTGGRIWLK